MHRKKNRTLLPQVMQVIQLLILLFEFPINLYLLFLQLRPNSINKTDEGSWSNGQVFQVLYGLDLKKEIKLIGLAIVTELSKTFLEWATSKPFSYSLLFKL